jgi:hypothetical protein
MNIYCGFIICIGYKFHGFKESGNDVAINAHEPPENDKNKAGVEKDSYCALNTRAALHHTLFNVVKPKTGRDSYQKNKEKNKLYRVSNAAKRWNMMEKFIGWSVPAKRKHERDKHEGNQHNPFLVG